MASSWPRLTSSFAARAPSSAPGRRAPRISSWPPCGATRPWSATAREVAFDLVDADPALAGLTELAAEIRLLVDDEDQEFLFKG